MKIKKITGVVLFIFMLTACLMFTACGDPAVESVKVTKLPDKAEYYIGETFSPEGGEITVTYDNGDESVVKMTDEGVEISEVNTSSAGVKTITVTYGGKRDRFTVEVVHETYTVTFNLNYPDAPAAEEKTVNKDDTIFTPEELENYTGPVRDGWAFVGWYTDAACTQPYDLETPVTGNLILYASWQDTSKTYYDAKFDHNYYGALESNMVTLRVEEGTAVTRPTNDPEREGYEFVGWYADSEGTIPYDFDSTFESDKTIYAKWNKTHSGSETFRFEAEDVDLTGKYGPGMSSTSGGTSMIVLDENDFFGASNRRFVSYLYAQQDSTTIEFYIASDMDVDNVTFVAGLAFEVFDEYTFTPENYIIEVNGQSVDYPPMYFTTAGTPNNNTRFAPFTLATDISLKEGQNVVKFITNNTLPEGEGVSTMVSAAPCIDYIEFTATDAVLIWDGEKGLPKPGNYY
ncbi:MAG TPA: InlB B-repeat-containing protein [Firmicutes bacterium]|nr:InlB B-repeat-containing protein [Bacillota bacterium]